MKQLANVRKAVAGQDDTTLTRWIKEPGRHTSGRPVAPMPADATGTRFKTRVLQPVEMKQMLVSGHSNVKIGRDVRKGHLRGYWIYTLSLEERATCPRSCEHWRDCFGNAMPFGKRVDHTGDRFLELLEKEIGALLAVRGREGILIRLHALGDFYSTEYVAFWRRMLKQHDRLAIFGYTARNWLTEIGNAIADLKLEYGERFAVRWSDGGLPRDCTVSVSEPVAPAGTFLCPEQTGQTACCSTCAACWSTDKNVAFQSH